MSGWVSVEGVRTCRTLCCVVALLLDTGGRRSTQHHVNVIARIAKLKRGARESTTLCIIHCEAIHCEAWK